MRLEAATPSTVRRGLRRLLAGALMMLSWADSPSTQADTVELRNGQRIEGRLRETTLTTVVIESGGGVVVLDREHVAAVYFDPPPAAPPSRPSAAHTDLFQALGALRALSQTPPAEHTTYVRAVADAKAALDRYLQEPGLDSTVRGLITDAWSLYAVAGSAWEARATHNAMISMTVGRDPVLERCPGLQRVVSRYPAPLDHGAALRRGVAVEAEIGTLWSCAAARLAEAERAGR